MRTEWYAGKSVLILLFIIQLSCCTAHEALVHTKPDKKPYDPSHPSEYEHEKGSSHVCMVIRTYWGHGSTSTTGLKGLLTSLHQQTHNDWEAVVIVLDRKPFEELAQIIDSFKDDRIWAYAEWIGQQYASKEDGVWLAGYHGILYDLTDEAIRACSSETRWVLATNGDNEYAKSAFSHLVSQEHADIVAFDFYSRYHRATGSPCFRFAQNPDQSECKQNRLRWCQTDLGAYAMNWPRLVSEDMRFGNLAERGSQMTPDHFDGVMAESLIAAGWSVHHVNDSCLYEHDPSPQRCAKLGGSWDDTLETALQSPGGQCLATEELQTRIQEDPSLKVVEITLSHDRHLEEFPGGEKLQAFNFKCLMDKDPSQAQERAQTFFPSQCGSEETVQQAVNTESLGKSEL